MIRVACRVGVVGLALWALGPAALSVGRVEAQFRGVGGSGLGFGGRGFGGLPVGGHPGYGGTTVLNLYAPYSYGYGYGYTPYVATGGYGGYPGWGWGAGWNYYYGGPFGGAGYSLYDIDMLKQQQYALNASRYNVETAQAAQAYQAANYYQQQAVATALNNYKEQAALREKFNTANAAPALAPKPTPGHPTVPLESLYDRRGQVIWPAVATRNDNRDAADSAMQVVVQEYRKRGRASVASVLDARDKLYAYGRPALSHVRRQRPTAGEPFKDFLNNLDVSLDLMADPPAKDDKGAQEKGAPPPPPKPADDK
jgi:hypothetical protein